MKIEKEKERRGEETEGRREDLASKLHKVEQIIKTHWSRDHQKTGKG